MLDCIATRVSSKMAETEVKNFAEILEKFEGSKPCREQDSACPHPASIFNNNTGEMWTEKTDESQRSGRGDIPTKLIYTRTGLAEVYADTLKPVEEALPNSTSTATIEAPAPAPTPAPTAPERLREGFGEKHYWAEYDGHYFQWNDVTLLGNGYYHSIWDSTYIRLVDGIGQKFWVNSEYLLELIPD